MILNSGAPLGTTPTLRPRVLLLGVDSELLLELLKLSSLELELVSPSLLEDSDESRTFFPAPSGPVVLPSFWPSFPVASVFPSQLSMVPHPSGIVSLTYTYS